MTVVLVFGVFLAILLGGLWAPFAIALSALLYSYLEGGLFGLRAIGLVSWGGMYSFTLTAVPLFLLMAELLLLSGVANRVYRGLSVLVAVVLIEGNLRREIDQRLPETAPAFFFIDIQPDQVAAFDETVAGIDGMDKNTSRFVGQSDPGAGRYRDSMRGVAQGELFISRIDLRIA